MIFLCLVVDLKEHLKHKNSELKERTEQKNLKHLQMLRKLLERDYPHNDEESRKTFLDSITCYSQADKITFENMPNALCGCQANASFCISSEDKRIAIVGQTEVGKSYLAKILMEKLHDKFSYVFYVSVLQHEKKMNLLEFLTNFAHPPLPPTFSHFQTYMFQSIIHKLVHHESVCIVLDDIVKNSFSSNWEIVSPFKEYESKHFFLNILMEKLFLKAKKVFVMTPFDYFQFKMMTKNNSDFRLINVLGIDTEAQQHLLKTKYPDFSCNVDDEKKTVLKCIAQNHDIKSCSHAEVRSLCYVPSHFKEYLSLRMKIEKGTNGSTKILGMNAKSSVVFVLLEWLERTFKFCKKNISESCKKNISESCTLDSIGRFAWEQLIKKQYFFENQVHLTKIEKNMFFIALQEPLFNTFYFCFSHILLQELLSALWLLCLSNDEFKRETKDKIGKNDHFAVVNEFMIAITKNDRLLQRFQVADKAWKINDDNVTMLRTVSEDILEEN